MASRVSEILERKGYRLVTVAPDQPVAVVAEVLTRNRVGAAPVIDAAARMVGIISERDIMRGVSRFPGALMTLACAELMTREVITCTSNDSILEIMGIMTTRRIRHLPVVDNHELAGTLEGMISIGDIIKQRLSEAQYEVDELRRYILS